MHYDDGLRQKTMELTFSALLCTVRNFAGNVHEQIIPISSILNIVSQH